jgi:regulatory protein YycI of two-component signal transduction system YycFG
MNISTNQHKNLCQHLHNKNKKIGYKQQTFKKTNKKTTNEKPCICVKINLLFNNNFKKRKKEKKLTRCNTK